MKTVTTTPAATGFRQLTSYEIDYPMYAVCHFWSIDAYIEEFRMDVYYWIKTSCSLSDDQFGDPYYFELIHAQCIKLLEIAHVLFSDYADFKIDKDHPLRRQRFSVFGHYLEDQQVLRCPDLYFRTLDGKEINDVTIFFEDFFEFKSLDEWYLILDQLLINSREETSVVRNAEIGPLILEINEYLEKLMESIYVVYQTQAINFIAEHHPELLD
ncbi:hypothetical protein [Pedobacter caeni]|uniref:Uncharacterized protein n=1 Tax=Pedobacter caeni TaxID=288992 RepID=A0A1M4VDM9_9SPHI|nr:hypothetical protein [Pedobacter caeni]SHE66978.1 hypothetical protein SAMN04488522_101871 [Pedobacter caeni]